MKCLTHAIGAPVAESLNMITAGPCGTAPLHDIWLIEKLALKEAA